MLEKRKLCDAFETNLLLFRLLEPCEGCAAPYGYKHHMPLNTDTSAFSVSLFLYLALLFFGVLYFVAILFFHSINYFTFLD